MAIKTTTVTFRMAPDVKETLRITAKKEHRSIANMIEVMILAYAKNARVASRESVVGDERSKTAVVAKTRRNQ